MFVELFELLVVWGLYNLKKDYDNILDNSPFKFGFKFDCSRQKPRADQK